MGQKSKEAIVEEMKTKVQKTLEDAKKTVTEAELFIQRGKKGKARRKPGRRPLVWEQLGVIPDEG
jgi:hypothetical protein